MQKIRSIRVVERESDHGFTRRDRRRREIDRAFTVARMAGRERQRLALLRTPDAAKSAWRREAVLWEKALALTRMDH